MTAGELQTVMQSVSIVMREAITKEMMKHQAELLSVQSTLTAEVLALKAELAAIPKPRPVDDLHAVIEPMVTKAVAAIPRPLDGAVGPAGQAGENGKDVDPALLVALVQGEVAKAVAQLPAPKDGESVTLADVAPLVDAAVAKIPRPKDGQSVSLEEIEPLVTAEVTKAVALLPKAKDGASVSLNDLAPLIHAEVENIVLAYPKPQNGHDGRDLTLPDVQPFLVEQLTKAVADLPRPKDGRSLTVDDVAPLIASEVEKAVAKIPAAKDGVGITGGLIDRDGQLVITFTDGNTRAIGRVVGEDGRDVDPTLVKHWITEEVAKIPKPKDGLKGEDGRDGVSVKHLSVNAQGDGIVALSDGTSFNVGRLRGKDASFEPGALKLQHLEDGTSQWCFKDGTPIEGGTFWLPRYRGVWEAGKTYYPENSVTLGGSQWIALEQTTDKPGDGATAWRLAVKRGSEGKPGAKGEKGDPGKDHPMWFDKTK